jgi:hypothetical protein
MVWYGMGCSAIIPEFLSIENYTLENGPHLSKSGRIAQPLQFGFSLAGTGAKVRC